MERGFPFVPSYHLHVGTVPEKRLNNCCLATLEIRNGKEEQTKKMIHLNTRNRKWKLRADKK